MLFCVDRTVVYKSEHIEDNHNPFWDSFTIGLDKLCDGDLDRPLKITVMDWQRFGSDRVIGSFKTSASELIARKATRGNADADAAFEIQPEEGSDDDSKRGFIVVLNAQVNNE